MWKRYEIARRRHPIPFADKLGLNLLSLIAGDADKHEHKHQLYCRPDNEADEASQWRHKRERSK